MTEQPAGNLGNKSTGTIFNEVYDASASQHTLQRGYAKTVEPAYTDAWGPTLRMIIIIWLLHNLVEANFDLFRNPLQDGV